jgi:ribosome biogenesis protein MAK21
LAPFRTVVYPPFDTVLIHHILRSHRYVRAVYAKILDPELLTSSKQGMFLNVVFRTMKMDPSLNRVKAYVKRMLQVCSAGAPAGFICGALYMLSQVAKKRPEIMAMINLPEDIDGGEENFKDAPDSDEEDEEGKDEDEGDKEDMETDARRGPANASVPNGGAVAADGYDPRKREPQFCGAEQTCLWELVPLLAHHHPSVAAFAGSFKSGKAVQYTGDPLRDFVLLRFLDKFVYKKPKAKPSDRGGSVMQPKRGETDMDLVNTADFLKKDPSQIPEHELFFYQYFTHRAAKSNLNEDAAMAEVEAGAAAAPMADFAHEIAPDAFADDDDDDDDVGDFEGDPDEDAMYAALAAGDFEDEFDDDENDDDLDDFGGSASDSDEESSEPSKKGADAKKVDLDLGGSVFASAEDFAHMIEEDTGSQEKQSKWEGKQGRGDQRNPREGKPSRGDKQSRAEPKSFKPGASRRRPSKRARMTKRA